MLIDNQYFLTLDAEIQGPKLSHRVSYFIKNFVLPTYKNWNIMKFEKDKK